MGLFSDIGKIIKKTGQAVVNTAVSTIKTVANPKTLVNLAGGNFGAIGTDVANGLVNSASSAFGSAVSGAGSAAAPAAPLVKVYTLPDYKALPATPAMAQALVNSGKAVAQLPTTLPSPSTIKTSMTGKSGITGNPTIDNILQSAAGGALAAAGVTIAGTEAGNAAMNSTGWAAAKQWLKNNWIALTAGVAIVGGVVWASFFRKPKTGGGLRRKTSR